MKKCVEEYTLKLTLRKYYTVSQPQILFSVALNVIGITNSNSKIEAPLSLFRDGMFACLKNLKQNRENHWGL